MLYLLVALGFMFFAGVAMTINEGLWSNTIALLCILISGCASVAAGVPLGVMILDQIGLDAANAWYCVFAGIWGVFVLSLLVLRIVTDRASQVRVRFLPIVDKIGGILMGLFVATMLTSFAASTLLAAPIKAGAWKDDGGYQDTIEQFASPFFAVTKAFKKADNVNNSLL